MAAACLQRVGQGWWPVMPPMSCLLALVQLQPLAIIPPPAVLDPAAATTDSSTSHLEIKVDNLLRVQVLHALPHSLSASQPRGQLQAPGLQQAMYWQPHPRRLYCYIAEG